MKLLLLIIFLSYLLQSFVVHSDAPGYYWRDYYGAIPDDAFPGGTDINGGPIYIGQTFVGELFIPGKIYGSNKKNYYEFGYQEHETTNQVKILCTEHPEQLEWIQTDNEKLKVLTHAQLIVGGYEPGWITYLGRVRHNGEVLVGKIIAKHPTNTEGAGFWGTSNAKTVRFSTFEVLSFNKTAPIIIHYITVFLP